MDNDIKVLLEAILAELQKINERAEEQVAQAAENSGKADELMQTALNLIGGGK